LSVENRILILHIFSGLPDADGPSRMQAGASVSYINSQQSVLRSNHRKQSSRAAVLSKYNIFW